MVEFVQPALVDTVNAAVTVPDVGYIKLGFWVVLSTDALFVKSQFQEFIIPELAVLISVKVLANPWQTDVAKKLATGDELIITELVTVAVHELLEVKVRVIVLIPLIL